MVDTCVKSISYLTALNIKAMADSRCSSFSNGRNASWRRLKHSDIFFRSFSLGGIKFSCNNTKVINTFYSLANLFEYNMHEVST